MSRPEFLAWESASRDAIDFKRCYVDLAGDLVAGLLLSQMIYWNLPAKNGCDTKLIVERDGHMWLAKGRNDWYEECRITPKQYDRAEKIIEGKGLIESRIFKFAGSPTKHTRVCWETFLRDLPLVTMRVQKGKMDIPQRSKSNSPKGEKPNSLNSEMDFDVPGNSSTETTAETTPQTPAENTLEKTTTDNKVVVGSENSFDEEKTGVQQPEEEELSSQSEAESSGKAKQEHQDALVAQLTEFGVTYKDAVKLAGDKPESCVRQIEILKFGDMGRLDNPGGYLAAAIRDDYAPSGKFLREEADKKKAALRRQGQEKQAEADRLAAQDKTRAQRQEDALLDAMMRRLSDDEVESLANVARFKTMPLKTPSGRARTFPNFVRAELLKLVEGLSQVQRDRLTQEVVLSDAPPLYLSVPMEPKRTSDYDDPKFRDDFGELGEFVDEDAPPDMPMDTEDW